MAVSDVFVHRLTYLEHQLYVPIVLSQEYDAALGLCTAVLPSAAFILGYHFILKPRRREERLAYALHF